MATLAGNAINTSYQGLLKTTDNAAVGATAKAVTDGSGNAINLEIGTSDINFTGGTVDFSGASVVNLSGYTPGLVPGTSGNDSMQSAAFLTPVLGAASATGNYSVAIGTGNQAPGQQNSALGPICRIQSASANNATAIGASATVYEAYGIQIGNNAAFLRAVGMGWTSISQARGVSIGNDSDASESGVGLGDNARSTALQAVAIGHDSLASAQNAVALGNGITASTADYTTTNNLQLANYASLDFASDSAAATGGVPLGGIYHTSGALKIRIS